MNELTIFNSEEFGQIRTVTINGEPYFVGKDVAESLGYERTADAIRQHVDKEDKGVGEIPTPGGKQKMTIINESGLYALIFGSKLESAKRFKHWVTSEVLPSIRTNGGYILNQDKLSDEELLSKALLVADRVIKSKEEKLKAQEKQLQKQEPLVTFALSVSKTDTLISITDYANLLSVGRNKLFKFLRSNKILKSNNLPYQKYLNQGYFEVKELLLKSYIPYAQTFITGKGQLKLHKIIQEGVKNGLL